VPQPDEDADEHMPAKRQLQDQVMAETDQLARHADKPT
jgi:hypothetical protein